MDQDRFTLSDAKLAPLQALLKALKLSPYFKGKLSLQGADPILRSPHRLGEAVSQVLALDAIAAAALWQFRTGQDNDIAINMLDAIHFLHPTHFIWQAGYKIELGAESVPTNGLYPCKDGRFIMIEAGPPYRKLETAYLNLFACANNREAIAKAIAKWDAAALEETLAKLGLPGCIAYTREQWREHPQGKILQQTPVIEIEKIASAPPCPFSPDAIAPLAGVKVLDFTHVLAGPRSTRTLAEFGADVLHISSPYCRDTLAQNFAVNHGKRSAYLDLTQTKDQAIMQALLADSDIFANSYRYSVLERFNLTADALKALNPRGIICLSVSAYGHSGPWQQRSGFDQNGQVATGFAMAEGGGHTPRFSPVFYLTDLITAYFAAAGMMSALLLRATEGGSYHVKVSLAKSAMWVQDLGTIAKAHYENQPETDIYPASLITEETPYGKITHLKSALQFSNMPKVNLFPASPFGAHLPKW